jgi:hypothetical protein
MSLDLAEPVEVKQLIQSKILDGEKKHKTVALTLRDVVLLKPIESTGRNAWSAGFWLKQASEKETVLKLEDQFRKLPEVKTLRSELKMGKFIWAKCLKAGEQLHMKCQTSSGDLKTYAELPIKEKITVSIQTDALWSSQKTPDDKFYRWTVTQITI